MSEAEFEELHAHAAERGAKRAVADVELEGEDAASDIRNLRSLLDTIRITRRTLSSP